MSIIQKEELLSDAYKSFIHLPTESVYVLATKLEQINLLYNFSKTYELPFEPIFLFKDAESVLEYTKEPSITTKLLLKVLTPGPVIFELPSNGKLHQNETFLAYIPNNQQTLSLLRQSQNPLVSLVPRVDLNLPVTRLDQIQNSEYLKEFSALEFSEKSSNLLPGVISCLDDNQFEILHPGVIPFSEIRKIIPTKKQLVRNYGSKVLPKNSLTDIYYTNSIKTSSPDFTLVLGTKEKLKESFNLGFLNHFQYKQIDNFVLINLGSSSNPEGVARKLYENLLEIGKMGVARTVILSQSWGKNPYSEIINHTFNQIVTPVFSNSPAEMAQMDWQSFNFKLA